MTKEKLWTKDFLSITAISFFIFLVFYVLLTALPLLLVKNLHAGADKVGLVLTLFLIAAIVIRPFAGKWVSKGSHKKILIYSAIAFLISTMLYPFATNIWSLYILRIFHGFTFGVITTVKGTISAVLIPDSRRGEGLSFFSLAMGLAMVFGPFIGLTLANIDAYTTLFIFCMVISVVNVVLSFMMNVPANTNNKQASNQRTFTFNDIIDKKAAKYAISIFILATAYSGVSSFLALFAKELHLVTAASYFFLIYAVFMLVFRPFTGRWTDKYGAKVIVYPCILIYAIGMITLSQTYTSVIMIIAGALIGIGYGSITPIFQTQIISSVERHRVGIANSMYFNAQDLGMAVGSFALGIVANSSGYRNVYFSGVILVIIGGLLYYVLTKNKAKKDVSMVTDASDARM